MNTPSPEPLWAPTQTSVFLGIPVSTLYQWRRRGYGPPVIRVGRHLRYEPCRVRTWLAAQADRPMGA